MIIVVQVRMFFCKCIYTFTLNWCSFQTQTIETLFFSSRFSFSFLSSVVQIIDDDKGVHIIAAIGLYESALFSSAIGISVCKTLVNKQVGCAIGMASGSTFCGVTGCNTVACRWDITGPPAVRAARLMQYALKEEYETAIDESVFSDPIAATQMKVLASKVQLKGSPGGITVYTFTDSFQFSAYGILETKYGT